MAEGGQGRRRASGAVLAAADRQAWQRPGTGGRGKHEFEKELLKEQLEFATKPVTDMAELQEEIVRSPCSRRSVPACDTGGSASGSD
ncbi:hypothetical protein ACFTWH_06875 [Streptomyces sp. NPDC057011]|uniref:hypothetical protein n=1 Tax=unclassified Streptomyces TaxID=2593676 RepID=UPI00363C35FE